MAAKINLTNINDGEVVHQRCIILTGVCGSISPENEKDYIGVTTLDVQKQIIWPYQTWPVSKAGFKVFCVLSPGENCIALDHPSGSRKEASLEITLTYIPLLQIPPLHLAILIAKDSPLIIDCHPSKRGYISSAHSDLNGVIQKFRMTAYMWQAVVAEEMRANGLERRSFRIEEEWGPETLSCDTKFKNTHAPHMNSTAKVNLLRTDQSVEEIRDASFKPIDSFAAALTEYGGPFASSQPFILAGLILDSTSHNSKRKLGKDCSAFHDPKGQSIATFGSEMVCTWPRFMEEITSCLKDTAIADQYGKSVPLWTSCSFSQAGLLSLLGQAFGSKAEWLQSRQHSLAQQWPAKFLGDSGPYQEVLDTQPF